MPISEEDLSIAVDVAIRAADVAVAIISRAMDERSVLPEAQAKSNSTDLVTQYDKQCEEEVLSILRMGTPNYTILSEETHSDTVLPDAPTWVVDPIDGTTSFIHGLYDCCVSIALVVDKVPVLGVIACPRLQEVYTAVKGRGAYCNGERIHVSNATSLSQSMVFLHQSYNRTDAAVNSTTSMIKDLAKIPVHSVRNNGAAALDMCFVAAGRAEAYLEVGIYPWDYAAGTIIVREAGGVVHDAEDPTTFDLTRRCMCCGCCTPITHALVDIANKYDYRNAILTLPK